MLRRDFLRSLGGVAAAMAFPTAVNAEGSQPSVSTGVTPSFDTELQGEDFWRQIQQSFSVNRAIVNLDNGAVCPSPRVVTEALVRYTWQQQEAPARILWNTLAPLWQSVRDDLSRFFGCDAGEVAIVRNATEALNNVLLGIELKPGDEILATTHDYWAVQDTLEQRAARDGVVIRKIDDVPVPVRSMGELVEMYERHVTPRTRLIVVTHPLNSNGQLFPVREICDMAHAKGIEVLVDGAQSFALVDYELEDLGCDYFAASLHKWMLAPIGTGMLYVRKDKIGKIWPLFPPDPTEVSKESMAKFHYQGTQSAAVGVAIAEALAFHRGLGPARKQARMRYLTRYWRERLEALASVRFVTPEAPKMSCGLAAFTIENVDPQRLVRYLWRRHRIMVQSLALNQTLGDPSSKVRVVRVTPNVYTTLDELDVFCEVMEHIARRGLKARA